MMDDGDGDPPTNGGGVMDVMGQTPGYFLESWFKLGFFCEL